MYYYSCTCIVLAGVVVVVLLIVVVACQRIVICALLCIAGSIRRSIIGKLLTQHHPDYSCSVGISSLGTPELMR